MRANRLTSAAGSWQCSEDGHLWARPRCRGFSFCLFVGVYLCSIRNTQGARAYPQEEEAEEEEIIRLPCGRGGGSVAGLQLRVRFVPAALLALLRTALALQCVSKARDWTGHVGC
jgi:hypothetical protein